MARIQLSKGNGFSLLPEGTHNFKVVSIDYDEDFGTMKMDFVTSEGLKHEEKFFFIKKNGEANDGGINVFSYLAKTIMNNFDIDDVDPDDLVGGFFYAVAKHEKGDKKEKSDEHFINVRLNTFAVSDGFEESESSEPQDDNVEEPTEDGDDNWWD